MAAQSSKKAPRRKVVSSYKAHGPTNMLSCALECGHNAAAYPRVEPGNPVPQPPKTVACLRCLRALSINPPEES